MQIKEPVWSKIAGDTKTAWIWESDGKKEMVIAQFVTESKSIVPVTKNRNLHTVYMTNFNDGDGYNSDFTVNTQNSERTFQFNTNSTMFDATTDDISREEFITLKSDWGQSKFDDIEGAADLQIQQFPPTSSDATDSFYDSQGNICAQKSDLEEDSVVSDASSTSSGSRRRSYSSRPRKEKKKIGKQQDSKMERPDKSTQFPNASTTQCS